MKHTRESLESQFAALRNVHPGFDWHQVTPKLLVAKKGPFELKIWTATPTGFGAKLDSQHPFFALICLGDTTCEAFSSLLQKTDALVADLQNFQSAETP